MLRVEIIKKLKYIKGTDLGMKISKNAQRELKAMPPILKIGKS